MEILKMTGLSRRQMIASAVLAPFAGASLTGSACAQSPAAVQGWPGSQVIKFTVPFPAGGSTDAVARIVQPGMQQRLGTTIIVENRAGGASSIGAAAVAKSPPDGLNWLFVFDSHAVIPSLMPLTFDARKDLDPVFLIGTAPMVLACHPSRPFKTLADVMAASRAAPDTLSYGTIGNGSLGHLTMTLLQKKAGFVVKHIPYRGGGPVMNDALGGHIDLIIGSAALMASQIEAGTLRPLLQTGETRLARLPAVQTMIEAGFKDFAANAWWGIFAPANTAKPVIERMVLDLTASFKDEKIARTMSESQQITLRLEGPDAFRAFYEKEMEIWGAVVRENAIKPD
jgi:tripartite-type tricarboxylate transporter receptor subunit TctC